MDFSPYFTTPILHFFSQNLKPSSFLLFDAYWYTKCLLPFKLIVKGFPQYDQNQSLLESVKESRVYVAVGCLVVVVVLTPWSFTAGRD